MDDKSQELDSLKLQVDGLMRGMNAIQTLTTDHEVASVNISDSGDSEDEISLSLSEIDRHRITSHQSWILSGSSDALDTVPLQELDVSGVQRLLHWLELDRAFAHDFQLQSVDGKTLKQMSETQVDQEKFPSSQPPHWRKLWIRVAVLKESGVPNSVASDLVKVKPVTTDVRNQKNAETVSKSAEIKDCRLDSSEKLYVQIGPQNDNKNQDNTDDVPIYHDPKENTQHDNKKSIDESESDGGVKDFIIASDEMREDADTPVTQYNKKPDSIIESSKCLDQDNVKSEQNSSDSIKAIVVQPTVAGSVISADLTKPMADFVEKPQIITSNASNIPNNYDWSIANDNSKAKSASQKNALNFVVKHVSQEDGESANSPHEAASPEYMQTNLAETNISAEADSILRDKHQHHESDESHSDGDWGLEVDNDAGSKTLSQSSDVHTIQDAPLRMSDIIPHTQDELREDPENGEWYILSAPSPMYPIDTVCTRIHTHYYTDYISYCQ